MPPNLPKTASEVQPVRRDPAPRPLVALPQRGVEVMNKDPKRRYVLVDKGAGGNRELICPESYQEIGYRIERWQTFEGLKGADEEAAQLAALRFRGAGYGRPGEPMERLGHVLMSIDLETFEALQKAAQDSMNETERQVLSPDLGVNSGRAALRAARVGPEHMSVSAWDGSQG